MLRRVLSPFLLTLALVIVPVFAQGTEPDLERVILDFSHLAPRDREELNRVVQRCSWMSSEAQKLACYVEEALPRSAEALRHWQRGWQNIHTDLRASMLRLCSDVTSPLRMHQCLRDLVMVNQHSGMVGDLEALLRLLADGQTPSQLLEHMQSVNHVFLPIYSRICGRNPEATCFAQVTNGLLRQLNFAYDRLATALDHSVAVSYYLAQCESVAGMACHTAQDWGRLRWTPLEDIPFSPRSRTRFGYVSAAVRAAVASPRELEPQTAGETAAASEMASGEQASQQQDQGTATSAEASATQEPQEDQQAEQVKPQILSPGDGGTSASIAEFCAQASQWRVYQSHSDLSIRRAAKANLYFCKVNQDSQLRNNPHLKFLAEVGAQLFARLDNREVGHEAELRDSLDRRYMSGMTAALAGHSSEFLQEFLARIETYKDYELAALARSFDVTQTAPVALVSLLRPFCEWVQEIELSSTSGSLTEGFPMLLRGQSICEGTANPQRGRR